MGQNNIIELNGKQYDARTGSLLGQQRIKATPERRQHAADQAAKQYHGRVIDGFVKSQARTTALAAPAAATPKPKAAVKATVARRRSTDVHWPASKSKTVTPHRTERSKTLMRHVVRKPHTDIKPAIKPVSPAELQAKRASELAKPLEKKMAVTAVDPVRLSHAVHIPKSHHVQRFHQDKHQPIHHQVGNAVAPAVKPTPATYSIPEPTTPKPRPSSDIFEAALARATSHTQEPVRPNTRKSRSHRRLVSVLAGVATFVIIGGFVTYLNMPAIELKVASMRAGFHAVVPAYQPTGYAMADGIKSSRGQVSMSFRSGDSSYKVTQVASDWNSQTLLDYYTDRHGAPSQTVQSQGRIVYIYDDGRATWVMGGVRYEISGNRNLTSKDLISLATSM